MEAIVCRNSPVSFCWSEFASLVVCPWPVINFLSVRMLIWVCIGLICIYLVKVLIKLVVFLCLLSSEIVSSMRASVILWPELNQFVCHVMGKLLRKIIFNWSSITSLLILFTLFAKACIVWSLKWWACTVTFLGFLHFELSVSSIMWSLALHPLANSFIILVMSNSLWSQRRSGKMGMMLVVQHMCALSSRISS